MGRAAGAVRARALARARGADVDVNVVVGGGLTAAGGLPPWVQRRYAEAASLHAVGGAPVLCSGAGTPHRRPPLDKSGFVVHEASAGARFLLELGVPPQEIVKETASYDTIGNAYFSLACHCIPRRWTRLRVVTSDFHMDRTRLAFEWLADLAGRDLRQNFEISFVAVSDEGAMADGVLAARREREAHSVENLRENVGRLRTFAAASEWLHTEHRCYAVSRQHEVGEGVGVDPEAMKSY